MKLHRSILLLSLVGALVAGCEGDGDNPYADKLSGKDKDSGSAAAESPAASSSETPAAESGYTASNDIVGTWALTGEGKTWYGTFSKNGSWIISDDKAGAKVRVYGTYTAKGENFSGPMTNPGVGTGKIEGSYSENSMTLYFTEYWHTPAKTVHYKGTR